MTYQTGSGSLNAGTGCARKRWLRRALMPTFLILTLFFTGERREEVVFFRSPGQVISLVEGCKCWTRRTLCQCFIYELTREISCLVPKLVKY